jgi:hypothetical protein
MSYMKVYELLPDSNNYEVLTYANPEDSKNVIGLFCGEPIGALWKPVKVIILRDDNHQDRPPSDFPSWGGVRPVFSRRAVSALGELLTANGELLPLECESGDYMAYNVTCVRNALGNL